MLESFLFSCQYWRRVPLSPKRMRNSNSNTHSHIHTHTRTVPHRYSQVHTRLSYSIVLRRHRVDCAKRLAKKINNNNKRERERESSADWYFLFVASLGHNWLSFIACDANTVLFNFFLSPLLSVCVCFIFLRYISHNFFIVCVRVRFYLIICCSCCCCCCAVAALVVVAALLLPLLDYVSATPQSTLLRVQFFSKRHAV